MRAVTTFLVMCAMVGIGVLIAVAVLDPLTVLVTSYDLNGMDTQVNDIHVVLVKYMGITSIGVAFLWAVFRILRTERQQL